MVGISNFTKEDEFFIIKRDKDLIKEAIYRILTTPLGSCFGMPNFGSRVRDYLFNSENLFAQDIEREIKNALERQEPRIVINSVDIKKEAYRMLVVLNLTIKNTLEDLELDFEMEK